MPTVEAFGGGKEDDDGHSTNGGGCNAPGGDDASIAPPIKDEEDEIEWQETTDRPDASITATLGAGCCGGR
jgi:hypothetical protein